MGSPATRLDRLVSLLDIGSSQSIRSTAAVQLGQIAALRVRGASTAETKDGAANPAAPYRGVEGEWAEVTSLLSRITPLLLSKSWETRNAASQALYHICLAAGVWDPDTAGGTTTETETPPGLLHFVDFNLGTLLAAGTKLLASAGKEYDLPDQLSLGELQHAKKDLLGKLGLGFGGDDVDVGVDMDSELQLRQDVKPPPAAAEDETGRQLSARERNQLKRKRKTEAKLSSQARPTVPPTLHPVQDQQKRAKHEGAEDAKALIPGAWPFTQLAEQLGHDLFSPMWEARHGAALGLRELFRTQGSGGGKRLGLTTAANDAQHAQWAEDLAVRLLCVFALDRLGDFVFDQVVAPVRETASQTLAQLLPHMSDTLVRQTHDVLLEMIRQDSVEKAALIAKGRTDYIWEVRHAGLLGLKYEVAVRMDLLRGQDGASHAALGAAMLTDVLDVALLGLRDGDDDVRAVAAAMLLPVTRELVEQHLDSVPALLDQLWTCIRDMKDDLSSSTSGVMDLLASLYNYPQVMELMQPRTGDAALVSLIPLLYIFFRHTISDVRLSVLNAMQAFLQADVSEQAWVDDRLVRLLFQNMIVEEKAPIRDATAKVWAHVLDILEQDPDRFARLILPHIPTLFKIVMMPIGEPADHALFYAPGQTAAGARIGHDVDKGILSQDLTLVGIDTVIRGRLGAASALGEIVAKQAPAEAPACALLLPYLASTSALQKCLAAVVMQRWAELLNDPPAFLSTHTATAEVHATLLALLDATMPTTYAEMTVMLQRMHHDCQTLLKLFVRDGHIPKNQVPAVPEPFTLDDARAIAETTFTALEMKLGPKAREHALKILQEQQRKILAGVERYQNTKETEDILVLSAVATAVIAWEVLPAKLNPVIRSIMNSIKYEENVDLQARSAAAVAHFLELCSRPTARVNPSAKIIKNLCAFVCQDTAHTPVFATAKALTERIYSRATMDAPRKVSARGKYAEFTPTDDPALACEHLIRRGADAAMASIGKTFGEALWTQMPTLWELSAKVLLDIFADGPCAELDDEQGQQVLDACSVLESVVPHVAPALSPTLDPLLTTLLRVIQCPYAVIRAAGARCFRVLTHCLHDRSMHVLVEEIVPLLGDARHVVRRQGAIEVISHTVRALDERLLPYVVFLVVPVLGRMSDQDEDVRLLATNTFAELVKLVPLIHGLADPPHFPPALLAKRQEEQEFLAQLMDSSKVQPYTPSVTMKVDLRKYQLDGVSWMAFLAKYQLHGILCDDMGLGKTLQSITLLSSSHHDRDVRWKATQPPDATPIPSLIVCPPTLTGHWVHEIKQYSPNLRPVLYAGQPGERARMQSQLSKYDAVIMSYDVVRNDIAALAAMPWHYCVLDEGHIICSAKTKTSRAVKQIRAQHRIILSGTPIQNNVLELWSLFDFLMPGFLGTEAAFNERYARPVLACRSGKPSASEQEAATLALEALQKQIVPFLLRRLKEDVLDDLPPKIIQDIECDLGDIQKELYDTFVRSQARHATEDALADTDAAEDEPKQHVFQTLRYLRKLANHPSLVLNPEDPKHRQLLQVVEKERGTLQGLANAPKLQAVRQLLLDCGIGQEPTQGDAMAAACADAAAVSQHRVLIFCQMKQMLDVIERDLFRSVMPSVTYLRLDGSVPTEKRHGIVQTFNSDPSIDVLLLTTSVGGLGLTLTGADTVIFVEHDWNPMKDLQAMDRAHRLGQKKVVNVYRLITRNTLEAKIMGLQQFKMNVASSVVTQQNKGMELMDTDQILDLFDTDTGGAATPHPPTKAGGISQKALLASLEQMSDVEEGEYAAMANWKPN